MVSVDVSSIDRVVEKMSQNEDMAVAVDGCFFGEGTGYRSYWLKLEKGNRPKKKFCWEINKSS